MSSRVRSPLARVAELADAQDSGSCARKGVGVQVPPRALHSGISPKTRPENRHGCESSGARRVGRTVRQELREHASKTGCGTVADAVEDQSEQRIQRA